MKISWLSIFAMMALWSAPVFAFNQIVLDAELNPPAKAVTGCVSVTFASLDSSFHDVHFRLYWNSFTDSAKGPSGDTSLSSSSDTRIDSVSVDGVGLAGPYKLDGTDLVVPISPTVAASRDVRVKVGFTSHIPSHGRRFGYKGPSCFLYGWFPMPAPIRDGHWLNLKYEEFTELAADCYDFGARLKFPESLQVFGAGLQRIDTSNGMQTAIFDLPRSHDFPLFVSKGYVTDTATAGAVKLIIHSHEKDRFVLDTLVETIQKTLAYMGDQVHPYPFDELVVVIGGLAEGGGLELPRMIILEEPQEYFSPALYRLLAIHETIHEWFYGVLNSNQALDPWMDEAVTEYFTGRVSASMAEGSPDRFSFWGLEVRFPEFRRFYARPFLGLTPIDRPVNDYSGPYEYFTVVYNKGYLVINTLVNLLSDQDRSEFWKRYYSLYAYKSPTPDEFLNLLSHYAPYRGSRDAWKMLENTEPLDYSVTGIKSYPISNSVKADSSRSTAEAYRSEVECTFYHAYDLPVDMQVTYRDGVSIDTTIVPVSGIHKFTFLHESPVESALLDPEYKYAIDINYLNNSLVARGAAGSGLRLTSGIMFLIQSIFSSVWGM